MTRLFFTGLITFLFFRISYAQDREHMITFNYPDNVFYHNGGRLIDVTQPPFNAKGDGVTDDSDALIAAYDFLMAELDRVGWDGARPSSYEVSYMLYFPAGTYLVSKPIIYSGDYRQNPNIKVSESLVWVRFFGENRHNTSIQLKDNSPGFEAGASQPVLSFGKGDFNNLPGRNNVRNLTIHTGKGNPGAIGIKMGGANNASMSDVSIISGDTQGEVGLDIYIGTTAGYFRDITVEGFNHGIRTYPYHFTFPVLEYITLKDQQESGMLFVNGPGSARKVLSENLAPAIKTSDGGAHAVVIDSHFKGGNNTNPAIVIDDGHFFGRNIRVEGYQNSVEKGGKPVVKGNIDEYVSDKIYGSGKSSMNLTVEEVPVYSWDGSMTTADDHGAEGDGTTNDSEAIQKAFDSGAEIIFFPKAEYVINQTIDVPATVKRVEFLYSKLQGNATPKFRIAEASDSPLILQDAELTGGGHQVEHNAMRTLVMDNVGTRNVLYTNKNSQSGVKLLLNACNGLKNSAPITRQQAWCRFINTESTSQQFVCDNATMWVMGYKTEKGHTSFEVRNGGYLEILGGLSNQYGSGWPSDEPMLFNNNSYLSAVACTNGPNDEERHFTTIIKDVQGDRSISIKDTEFPPREGRDYQVIVPLYVNTEGILTGMNLPGKNDYKLYSNPGDGKFILESEDESSIASVQILDKTGKTIKKEVFDSPVKKIRMKEFNISPGMYLVMVKDDQGKKTLLKYIRI